MNAILTLDGVIACIEEGLGCQAIANRFNVDCSTVHGFCNRHKLRPPPANRGGGNVKDLTGQVFGVLTVLRRNGSKKKLAAWECKCVCGKIVTYDGSTLRSGRARTCGCKTAVKSRRNWQGYGSIPKTFWSNIHFNADQRRIPVTVKIEDLDILWKSIDGLCQLSGVPISIIGRTASLDRIDSRQGYATGNIQFVHKDINRMKGSFRVERLIEMCHAISDHQRKMRNVVG